MTAVEAMIREGLGPHGHLLLRIFDPDGRIAEQVEADNLMCNAGLAQLAATVNWSAAQDQNANMGNPLTPQNLYPIYGAVGSSSTAPSASDTQLGAELGRSVISSASASGSQVLLTFYYGTTVSTWTITEAGVFVSGSSTATSAANTGLLLDHVTFAAVTKTSAQSATAQFSFTF